MNTDDIFEIQKINCEDNVLIFEKRKDNIKLIIEIYKSSCLKKLTENLPLEINSLELNFKNFMFYKDNIDCLDNIFINLPMNLNTIKFIYPHSFGKYMSNEHGYFNLLFGIKIPMNCQSFVLIDEITYIISYEKANILKLTYNDNKHTIEYNSNKKRRTGGGLMQLVAYGAQDTHLTKN